MLRIRPGARLYEPDDHPFLTRELRGYDPTMSPLEVLNAARGWWVLAEAAENEKFAVVVSRNTGLVVMAVAIERWEQDEQGRRAFAGRILPSGNPVHDRYVDQPDPTPNAVRSAVTYFSDDEFDNLPCRCGCGEPTRTQWRPGHDQRALHTLIRTDFDGSVAAFLDWYQAHHSETQTV
ncbi:hypothetical protein ACFQ2B_40395 [Streptomyces stramineus]|uniref:Uncharacterized protein n=1 Tax=Streptomyces stramineus TaxID=173861 RepID=A0ABP3JXD3_9ACTN